MSPKAVEFYRWRRWCPDCEIASLETVCFVCHQPMDLFTSWTAHRVAATTGAGSV